MKKVNKKILLLLLVLVIALAAITYYRSTYTKKSAYDVAFSNSNVMLELHNAEKEIEHCIPDEKNIDSLVKCGEIIENRIKKEMDVRFYNKGYEHCIKKFKKTPEECKRLLDKVQTDKDLNVIAPSNNNDNNIKITGEFALKD